MKLCVTFGFTTINGKSTFSELFTEDFADKDTVLVTANESNELFQLCGGNLAVGYLDGNLLAVDAELFLEKIQAYIDGTLRSKSVPSTILLIVGRDVTEEAVAAVETVVTRMVEMTPVEVLYASVDDAADALKEELEILKTNQNGELVTAQQLRQKLEQWRAPLGTSNAQLLSSDKSEFEAAEACTLLTESLLAAVDNSLKQLMTSGLMTAGATVNTTMQAVKSTVDDACADHSAQYAGQFAKYGSSEAMRAASYRARTDLAQLLVPVYQTISESMLMGSIEAFEKRMLKLPPVKQLPKLLKLLSSGVMEGFESSLSVIRDDFLAMVTSQRPDGLFASYCNPASCQWLPSGARKSAQWWWAPQYNFAMEKRRLLQHMKQRSTDRVNSLFLAGSYNPYVRDSALPPTHINLNYLLDPQALALGSTFDRLYDSHKEGPCENRADPLILPGVATFPFDPNQHPVAVEEKGGEPWWNSIVEFFTDI